MQCNLQKILSFQSWIQPLPHELHTGSCAPIAIIEADVGSVLCFLPKLSECPMLSLCVSWLPWHASRRSAACQLHLTLSHALHAEIWVHLQTGRRRDVSSQSHAEHAVCLTSAVALSVSH